MPKRRDYDWFTENVPETLPLCALCQRPIPKHAKQSLHHLIPKLRGGTHGPTVLLHQICHNEIHAVLTEAELARNFNTPDLLREHEQLATSTLSPA